MQYISHEARGPLQVANIGLELQLRDLDDAGADWPEERRDWLKERREQVVEVMQACSLAQEALNDMLTFDKLENGMLELECEPVALIGETTLVRSTGTCQSWLTSIKLPKLSEIF